VQFIANNPEDLHLVLNAGVPNSLLNSSEYSAETSVAFFALISKIVAVNRTLVVKIICKK
jgi:hypothetical protein